VIIVAVCPTARHFTVFAERVKRVSKTWDVKAFSEDNYLSVEFNFCTTLAKDRQAGVIPKGDETVDELPVTEKGGVIGEHVICSSGISDSNSSVSYWGCNGFLIFGEMRRRE
jgi:hypothetical protein